MSEYLINTMREAFWTDSIISLFTSYGLNPFAISTDDFTETHYKVKNPKSNSIREVLWPEGFYEELCTLVEEGGHEACNLGH